MVSISKSDFLIYLEAPLHLWALKNGEFYREFSEFDIHLMNQGYEVEKLAKQFLNSFIVQTSNNEELIWQKEFSHKDYILRTDGLVYKPRSDSYDLYEIKSGTKVDKENLYDVSFQYVVLSNLLKTDRLFLLHLNKDYIRKGELDISQLFIAEAITEKAIHLCDEVKTSLLKIQDVVQAQTPEGITKCLKPDECPCPHLCHPNLPENSIFNIPLINEKKKIQLIEQGILDINEVPDNFPLNEKQKIIVEIAKSKKVHIDREAIENELQSFEYPIYFLDYETCISALPLFENYHPQQQIVFQYSLHRMDSKNGNLSHFEHISLCGEEPSLSLLKQLQKDIGEKGTVIVWNKTFEMNQNNEMAKLHPQFAKFLEQLNDRIYDLGDIVNKGYFLHPGFKGSWSIKNVLPVLVPDLSYNNLEINKGDQASMAWWNLCFEEMHDENKIQEIKKRLFEYCELDTKAMVELLRFFSTI